MRFVRRSRSIRMPRLHVRLQPVKGLVRGELSRVAVQFRTVLLPAVRGGGFRHPKRVGQFGSALDIVGSMTFCSISIVHCLARP